MRMIVQTYDRRSAMKLPQESRLSTQQLPDGTKGEKMKKYSAAILTAVFGMATFAMGAKATTSDQLLVKVPYDFVVAGKTLPAGTYRVSRLSFRNIGELAITNLDNNAGVLLGASEWEDA